MALESKSPMICDNRSSGSSPSPKMNTIEGNVGSQRMSSWNLSSILLLPLRATAEKGHAHCGNWGKFLWSKAQSTAILLLQGEGLETP